MIYDYLIVPFEDYEFMRRALAGCLALSAGACPIGVMLVLRRLSLMGDAMSHAILPGAAVGFIIAGFSLVSMTIGGLVTGLVVAALAGIVSRFTALREDASFAAFYLASLGLGVLLISLYGSTVDLLNVLFGTVLSLSDAALILITSIATLTLAGLAVLFRPLVTESLDPGFLRSVSRIGPLVHFAFLVLVVINLVGGFHALGTLMVVGIMMLPAAASRFWSESVAGQMMGAFGIGVISCVAGLLVSFHLNLPASPAIILTASALYVVSFSVGPYESIGARTIRRRHFHT